MCRCFEEQALLSRILQMAESIGFKSGNEGCKNSFGQNPTIFLLHHSWTKLAVWDVASSCWRVIPASWKKSLTTCLLIAPNIRADSPLPLLQWSRGVFFSPVEATPAQIITEFDKLLSQEQQPVIQWVVLFICLLKSGHSDDCARPVQWIISHQSTGQEVACHF